MKTLKNTEKRIRKKMKMKEVLPKINMRATLSTMEKMMKKVKLFTEKSCIHQKRSIIRNLKRH